jgi:tetratricopeptide (TPR) repeat protein
LRLNNRIEETIPLLDKLTEINPEDFNPYLALASINKQLGKGVSNDHTEKARQFLPENDWYNRACLESVCDNFDLAFEYLQRAAQAEGFNPAWAWDDPDLQWLRDDLRFLEIVGPRPK